MEGADTLKIGYMKKAYPEERCIIKKCPDCAYVNLEKEIELPPPALKREFTKPLPWYVLDYGKTDLDLLHTFNFINLGSTPYVATFETRLPRYFEKNEGNLAKLFANVASDKCLKIIGLCWRVCKMQEHFIKDHNDAQTAEKILAKLTCMHPPQPVLNKSLAPLDGQVHFVFVGRDFFRKGGLEMLKTFEEVGKNFRNFHLHIIGELSLSNAFNPSHSTLRDVEEAKYLISRLPFITYFESLPNHKVLELLKDCHVGLLPTFQDTYGYSVLEMQASGLPCISTNVRALPEINNDKIGWMINFPRGRELGNGSQRAEVEENKRELRLQLKRILADILSNPQQIAVKSAETLQKIEKQHDPAAYGLKLRQIYEKALTATRS